MLFLFSCFFFFFHFFGSTSFSVLNQFFSTYVSVCYFFKYINAFGCYNLFHGFERVCFFVCFFFFSYSSSFLFALSFMFHSEKKMMSTYFRGIVRGCVVDVGASLVPMFTNTSVKHFELQAKKKISGKWIRIELW